jgi:hypothetical protein
VKVVTFPIIPNLAQTTAPNLTTVTSHHDRWKTNTLNTQHHKDGKTCMTTQDCRAKRIGKNGQGLLALLSRWLLLKVLEVELLKIPKVVGA